MTQLNETTNRAEMQCSDVNPGAVQNHKLQIDIQARIIKASKRVSFSTTLCNCVFVFLCT